MVGQVVTKNMLPTTATATDTLSFGQVIYFTANALTEAFPSFKHLSRGDVTLGLALVALSHSVDKLYHFANQNPKLFPNNTNNTNEYALDWHLKRYNPENVSCALLRKALMMAKYANLAYYPEAYLPAAKKKATNMAAKTLTLDDVQQLPSTIVQQVTSTTTTTTITHHHSYEYVYSVDASSHLQIPFVLFLDHQHSRIILSVRGTQDMMDIMTDFHFVPSSLSCYRYYKQHIAPHLNSKEQVHGHVHAGYYSTAKWVLTQIRPYLTTLWLTYANYGIVTTGQYV